MVGTSLVGVVKNGLSQLHGVTSRAQFLVALLRGLGGNLTQSSRLMFAKQVRIRKIKFLKFNLVTRRHVYSGFAQGFGR